MKIRYCKNIVLFLDALISVALFLITSFAYFLGFPINKQTLLFYFIALISISFLSIITYFIYILLCKTYVIFTDKEIIKSKKGKNKVLIKYADVKIAQYYNIFNLLIGDPKGGNLVIQIKDKNDELSYIHIPISKKNIRKLTKRYKFRHYSY